MGSKVYASKTVDGSTRQVLEEYNTVTNTFKEIKEIDRRFSGLLVEGSHLFSVGGSSDGLSTLKNDYAFIF